MKKYLDSNWNLSFTTLEWTIQGKIFCNHYTQGYTPIDSERYLKWLKTLLKRQETNL